MLKQLSITCTLAQSHKMDWNQYKPLQCVYNLLLLTASSYARTVNMIFHQLALKTNSSLALLANLSNGQPLANPRINHIASWNFQNSCLGQAQTTRWPRVFCWETSQQPNKQSTSRQITCSWCGSSTHRSPGSNSGSSKCPAKGRNCNNCDIANHLVSVCHEPSKQPSTIKNIDLIAYLHYDKTNDMYTSISSHTNEIPATVQSQLNVKPKMLFIQTVPPVSVLLAPNT